MTGRDFEGFTVVVTGASTGLGRAIAVETAQRGAGLIVVNFASNAQDAEETARLVQAHGTHRAAIALHRRTRMVHRQFQQGRRAGSAALRRLFMR